MSTRREQDGTTTTTTKKKEHSNVRKRVQKKRAQNVLNPDIDLCQPIKIQNREGKKTYFLSVTR